MHERTREHREQSAIDRHFAAQTLASDRLVMESTYFCVYAP